MIVTFCGHSKAYRTEELSQWLNTILPSLIEAGADVFYLGGYGTFDRLAVLAVKRQKVVYPNLESVLVLPYLNRTFDPSLYDSTTYPPPEEVPPRFAIVKRNEWMVSASDVVVSGVAHGWGGAAKTLDFARQKKKVIFQFPIHTGEHSNSQ